MSIAMAKAEPTTAHKAIAEFQKHHDAIIATQNIELLHEKAGSENVAHLHGSMRGICMRCRKEDIDVWTGNGAPVCVECGSRKTRPNVVLFGENLNQRLFAGLEKFSREADFVIAVGTSLNVFPAAGLVMDNSRKAIIINKTPTPFDKFVLETHHADADDVLPAVLDSLK
jgi:NAD-dependent deacetylase